MEERR
jgi:hypothetical protein